VYEREYEGAIASWLDRYEGCVAVAFCLFFFLQGAEETNTFYLITPRSQELCERIGLPMKAGLHCWWVDVAEW
jgi:hypothetical protein